MSNRKVAALVILAPWIVLAVVLLSSCATFNARTGTPAPATITGAVLQGWHDAGLPKCHLDNPTVYQATSALDFTQRCQGVTPEGAASCLATDNPQRGLRVDASPVAVLRPGQPWVDSTGGPVVHELMHWCSQDALGDLDREHKNPRVWEAAGGTESAQARAARMLAAPS